MKIFDHDPREGKVFQFLSDNAELLSQAHSLSNKQLKELYSDMVMVRALDDKAFLLQRQGRLGTFPQLKGAEAIQIAAASAMQKEDWLVPSYREIGMMYKRGVPFSNAWLFWQGNEIGAKFPNDVKVAPIAVPVGSQLLHAVGIAWAAKLKGEKLAVLACCGDGATSEGEVHEAFNFAGVYQLPLVFLVSNNQFAISVSRKNQTASKTIAEKAFGYGYPGVQVDGMDAFAMYEATTQALDHARAGNGPVLIEALTYRLCDHTTADDAKIYQDQCEKEKWMEKDGVKRLKTYLEREQLWSEKEDLALQNLATKEIEKTVKALEECPGQTPEEIFGHTFEKMTPRLSEQLKDLKQFHS